MSKGTVNKVILVGNLGKDPDLRYTPSGVAIANITLATTESWKDKATATTQDRTEWHRIVLYQRLAEIAGQYLKKGSKVFVEGRLKTSKWQDKNSGQDRYTTEIVADSLQMLDGKPGGAAPNHHPQSMNFNDTHADNNSNHSNMMDHDNISDHMHDHMNNGNLDDDIPF